MNRRLVIVAVLTLLCLLIVACIWWWQRSTSVSSAPAPPGSTKPSPIPTPPPPATSSRSAPALGIPLPDPVSERTLIRLDFPHFSVGYDDGARTPRWARYELDGPIIQHRRAPKRPRFAPDARSTARVMHDDFTRSGWERGHLVPAFAMWSRYGEEAWRATFTMVNVVPQHSQLNGMLWEDLEDDIAGQAGSTQPQDQGDAARYGHVTVIVGPSFAGAPQRLASQVPIPDLLFMVTYDLREGTSAYRAKAYLVPNRSDAGRDKERYRATIAAIEAATGLDLPPLHDERRSALATSISAW